MSFDTFVVVMAVLLFVGLTLRGIRFYINHYWNSYHDRKEKDKK